MLCAGHVVPDWGGGWSQHLFDFDSGLFNYQNKSPYWSIIKYLLFKEAEIIST
jgi:hypothetical protein